MLCIHSLNFSRQSEETAETLHSGNGYESRSILVEQRFAYQLLILKRQQQDDCKYCLRVFLTMQYIKSHFEILTTGRSYIHCRIKWSLLIKDLKPPLNKNVSSEKRFLYQPFIYFPADFDRPV